MRLEKRPQGFGEPRDVLGRVDQIDGEIARRTQHGDAERTDQHDLTGRRVPGLPQMHDPEQQSDRNQDRDHGVHDAHALEIQHAAPPCRHLLPDGLAEATELVRKLAEGFDERHVADDIDDLTVDRRGLRGEVLMQRLAGGRDLEQANDHGRRDPRQHQRHRQADGTDEDDRPECRRTLRHGRSTRTCSRA